MSHILTPWLLHLSIPPINPFTSTPCPIHPSAPRSIPVQTLLCVAGTKHGWIMAVKCHRFVMAAASSPCSPPAPSPRLSINQPPQHLNLNNGQKHRTGRRETEDRGKENALSYYLNPFRNAVEKLTLGVADWVRATFSINMDAFCCKKSQFLTKKINNRIEEEHFSSKNLEEIFRLN